MMTIQKLTSHEDVKSVIGKWIVQLDTKSTKEPNFEENPGFWLEKRISYVGTIYGVDGVPHFEPKDALIITNGLYYCHGLYTYDEFIAYWNSYVWTNRKGEQILHRENTRYHRLLTNKELDWLNTKLKN